MCGEQVGVFTVPRPPAGSPPRVRGTVNCPSKIRIFSWITPACAGNRAPPPAAGPRGEDHPRVCGEQSNTYTADVPEPGSPPRVRGTGMLTPIGAILPRITPACAGNSMVKNPSACKAWDHPRVCGEQQIHLLFRLGCQGSPPRVRGTVFDDQLAWRSHGITPACAGNSNMFYKDIIQK